MTGKQIDSDFCIRHDYLYGDETELYSFYKIPKLLIENVLYSAMSAEAKLLYAVFLDRASLSASNGWKDDNGRIYIIYQLEDIMRAMGCGNQKAVKILAELENKYGLIERKKQGFCKPNLIYVKSISRVVLNSHLQECENHISGSVKITSTEVLKPHTNYTNINKTNINKTESTSTSIKSENDEMEKRIKYKNYFDKNLSVEQLVEEHPTKREILYEIVDVILDTMCSNSKTIRIAKDDKPKDIVHSQFMKLNANHIRYVLDVLEHSSDIRNMKQYILTTLYNAAMTINNYITSQHNKTCVKEEIKKPSDYFGYFGPETKNEELLNAILSRL